MPTQQKNKDTFVKAKVNISFTPGEMLKTLRELQGLSQKQLSEITGMSQSNISALETNIRNIGRDRALVLAKELKVHPAVILFPDYCMEAVAWKSPYFLQQNKIIVALTETDRLMKKIDKTQFMGLT